MPSLKLTTTSIFVLISLRVMARADTIAWSGSHCDGGEGADVACNGRCINFYGRHSFSVPASGKHCVSVFEDASCNHETAVYLNQGGGSCQNVNTGGTVLGFKCFSGNTC
ncbi:hypothetical protein C8R45DRAFT_1176612 [Mycena sanguinolenta]|nr:hypothetical protein C8R45DRAFT_1176612 [Mycena sanguinolenta]